MMTRSAVMTPSAVIAVFPVPPRSALRAGRARRAGGAGQAGCDALPLEGDAPCLESVELLLVGDEQG
ncbi:hypothetical protein M878_23610 [Streptomyces roseochromogenus subsp. oscitans DS 12.976]|uniref:Uncharacterized protein n=1 Tax=Streptomyces roseochromogenus subsp. oscitans DS 12.976 TaxID=1352936 RepID=V6K7F0_STRRC|nr:hypothetical protein M878_23610 [Streptomyces roseochromogenus subsp. oscitans DS 12.976]